MRKNYFTAGRWKDWFAFSRRERRGIAVLLFILIAESLILLWLHYGPAGEKTKTDFTLFEKQADEFYASLKKKKEPAKDEIPSPVAGSEFTEPARLFYFDPNTLSTAAGKQLGLNDRVLKTIHNYRAKGGRFKKKEDLKKIYGMRKEDYERLQPYIVLDETKNETHVNNPRAEEKRFDKKPEPLKIDIGIADTIELLRIRGVGTTFARRIHTYRNKLGGFLHTDQLKEVYGMSDSLFLAILPQIFIADTSNIRKIEINTADYKALRNHPYIGADLAGIIFNYRKQHGAFKSTEDVHKISLVTDELYRKLAPYLSME